MTATPDLQAAKRVVRDLHDALDRSSHGGSANVLRQFVDDGWTWRGVHPFHELDSAEAVAEQFWDPLRCAFSPIQRRPDVFLAGVNSLDDDDDGRGARRPERPGDVWVMEMGHLLGLFDRPWLDIPATGRMCFLRYSEFNRVGMDGRIAETALFVDIPAVMRHAGHNPFPPQTGATHLVPGPQSHDGLLYEPQDPASGVQTLAVVDNMVAGLSRANEIANATGVDTMSYEDMASSWAEDMIWSGPEGIGSTYTITRYQQQHQYPFRFNLTDKQFNGHVTRFAEGDYACFFGWANLTNTPTGGFLGMPAGRTADMRVVDVYRRRGDKLAENWVLIDLLHWLSMQGLDVLARMRQLIGVEDLNGSQNTRDSTALAAGNDRRRQQWQQ